ncbi:dolichol-phosphate mannosyltransferase [Streptomyces albireticuli]|uniref:Dolichol-phosphate mannosyltransferase n=1 Tax=Streptomyces albireticuli TaxID=1940 RepID=A0A2A2CXZ0_9ACTN|nr:dolichol-phosphate mannosyltransferase [Streptomyces albireticuli]
MTLSRPRPRPRSRGRHVGPPEAGVADGTALPDRTTLPPGTDHPLDPPDSAFPPGPGFPAGSGFAPGAVLPAALPSPGAGTGAGPRAATVTVIVPTFNESGNVRELLRRLTEALPSRFPCDVLFVDDSTDDTVEAVREAARSCPYPVSVIHRREPVGGLGGAVVEGMRGGLRGGAPEPGWFVVMDADLQHPPALVPELVEAGIREGADLVVASRYRPGGSRAGLAGGYRVAVSRAATWLAKGAFPRLLKGVSDPMSGFFAIRREAVAAADAGALRPLGYKILLELAVRCRPAAVTELPFAFQERFAGESKSTAREGLRFLGHLTTLRTASSVARMLLFGLIGLTGFLPNLLGLHLLTTAGLHYLPAEIVANQFGVLWNFLLIEVLLFRDRRRHRHWADRVGRFALLANADLLLRIPLIAFLVGSLRLGVLPATVIALLTTFVLRFAATEALVYLPRKSKPAPAREGGAGHESRKHRHGTVRRRRAATEDRGEGNRTCHR